MRIRLLDAFEPMLLALMLNFHALDLEFDLL
jgi:hypothetical protein